jgi:uncharacterized protein (TIGR00255 family)
MPIRSMTAFAQAKGEATGAMPGFAISLKSVNHRFLDLHLRMPGDTDALELKLRRLLKERIHRGHVELTLSIDRTAATGFSLNKELIGGYIQAFREAEREFAINSSPDLNAIFKMPGALSGAAVPLDGNFEAAVLTAVEQAIASLDAMRIEEGKGIDRELRDRMARLRSATSEIERLRPAISKAHMEKIHARLRELISTQADNDRVLQEAAIMAERSDVQEEIVRMHTHIQHFLGLLDEKGEIGKKLDFLLQEMNREANTLLSKTAGVSGEGLRITEFGLAMKSEIEKSREQVQNVE